MSETVEDKLKQMLVDRMILKMRPEDIDATKSLADDYGIDSVCILEMVVGIEELFGVTIEDQDFNMTTFRSLSSMADYIRQKQATK